jgi:MoxR-like ATPase
LTQASQAAAVLAGRDYVVPDDVKELFLPVCVHRVISKTYLANGDNNAIGRVLRGILDKVATPK